MEVDKGNSGVIKRAARALKSLIIPRADASKLLEFLKKITLLPQQRERRELENMELYLETVAKLSKELQELGTPKSEIRKIVKDLNVPLIEANLKAMVFLRAVEHPEKQHESEVDRPEA